jgi:hypothetical protein
MNQRRMAEGFFACMAWGAACAWFVAVVFVAIHFIVKFW